MACPFTFLSVESAVVANPPKKYSLGNDFVLVYSLAESLTSEKRAAPEIVRSDMSSEKAVFGKMSIPCPAGEKSPGLHIQLLQTGVYDTPGA